ncbi:hypothetical protein E2320_009298, partial [Naja naja]
MNSRNQLSTLPVHLCNLPLKVLIASNNKLVSIPEDIGQLRHLMELDVSCNEIQTIPPQIGNLNSLRDLNIRRNHLVHLPEELADLPLIRLDFSCNKITTIPVCYRNLRHLQTITLDNNPLQSPPAQVMYSPTVKTVALDGHEDLYSSRPYGALDSGFNSVDSGDKRWSGNEPTDEFSDLPLRVAEITKEQRLRRESHYQEHRGNSLVTNGGDLALLVVPDVITLSLPVEQDLDQIDFIDSCATEEDEEEVRQAKCPEDAEELKRPESLSLMQDRERPQGLRSFVDRLERGCRDSAALGSLSNAHNQLKASQSPRKQNTLENE